MPKSPTGNITGYNFHNIFLFSLFIDFPFLWENNNHWYSTFPNVFTSLYTLTHSLLFSIFISTHAEAFECLLYASIALSQAPTVQCWHLAPGNGAVHHRPHRSVSWIVSVLSPVIISGCLYIAVNKLKKKWINTSILVLEDLHSREERV